MEATELRKLAALEDRHWWYAERRALLRRALRTLSPSTALDIGAAGGGNTRTLVAAGWTSVALEYSAEAAEIAHERGLNVIRADARALPFPDAAFGLVVAFDILEHVEEDDVMAAEIARVLRPGGTALIAVPADMKLWSAHDVAVHHVRRYDRDGLADVLSSAGLVIEELGSWNVLLRPVAAWRRKRSTGSDLDELSPALNAALRATVAAERFLPVKRLPGVSLMARVRRP